MNHVLVYFFVLICSRTTLCIIPDLQSERKVEITTVQVVDSRLCATTVDILCGMGELEGRGWKYKQ
jgi:hypothetical protein